MKKMGRRILWILILIILFLFSFAVVYPLIFLFGGSLNAGTGKQSCGVVVRGWNSALDLAAF